MMNSGTVLGGKSVREVGPSVPIPPAVRPVKAEFPVPNVILVGAFESW
jgi:hypothetical protein